VNDEKLARFIERSENKYWGKYRGFVDDRDDKEKLGRLKLRVPSVLGDAITGWAWPAMPYAGANLGTFFLPQKDDLVWVEFVEGELEHPIWSGGGWGKPGGTAEIPDEAKDNYPDTQVIKTKSGHVIVLDDKDGSELIKITDKGGSVLTMKQDGTFTLQAKKTITLIANDGNGSTLTMDDQGKVSIKSKADIEIIANDGNGDITIKANNVSATVTAFDVK